jgi:glycine/D-amino acid oxidase-like deaminating enzyme
MAESKLSGNDTRAPIEDVVVLGGGTAGWMTASYLKKTFPRPKITVLEAPASLAGMGPGLGARSSPALDPLPGRFAGEGGRALPADQGALSRAVENAPDKLRIPAAPASEVRRP